MIGPTGMVAPAVIGQGFPVADPEFWLVTAAAAVAMWAVWRLSRGKKLVPGRRRPRPRGASLTIEGRPAPSADRRKARRAG